MSHLNSLDSIVPTTVISNSGWDMLRRVSGNLIIVENAVITGTGVVNANVFKVIGTILVLNTWAEITEITTLTNLTNMYADVYDGTNTIDLTKTPGAVLSGAPVGTFFTKDKASTETYSVAMADEVRVLEATAKKCSSFLYNTKKQH